VDLTRVILGEVVTEKAERLRGKKTHTLRVRADATKIDVKNALRRYFGVDPLSVRVLHVRPKKRLIGRGREIEKRHHTKRALVTLASKSKVLDLTSFQS
jgi:ribosomal protein L23